MKILILAGGYGTRLYPIIKDYPKGLLEVQKKPLANHILNTVGKLKDIKEVILVSNNKFAKIFEDWAAKQKYPWPIKVVNDQTNTPEERLGSIGDIQYVIDHHPINDDLLIVGGDNLFNFNLQEFIAFCQKQSPNVTIGLYDIHSLEESKKFGVVELNKEGRIVSFQEKPPQPKSSLIAMCFYYLPKKSLGLVKQYLDESKKSDTAGDYIRWLSEKTTVFGFKFSGKWYDIGSVEAYKDAEANYSEE